jgi:hypothetical protein
MEAAIIHDCKELIERQPINTVKAHYTLLMETDFDKQPDWPYILQKVYIHACLKKKTEIAAWLTTLFETEIDPINRIAYRQMFAYGRHLLSKKR